MMSVLVLLLAPLTIFGANVSSRDSRLDHQRQCSVLVDLMMAEGGAFISKVDGEDAQALDCREFMDAAGVPTMPFSERAYGREFGRVRFLGADEALVRLDSNCPLCGHGEKLRVYRRGGRWVIVQRWQTWIS